MIFISSPCMILGQSEAIVRLTSVDSTCDRLIEVATIDAEVLVDQCKALSVRKATTMDRFSIFSVCAVEALVERLMEVYTSDEIGFAIGNMLGGWGYAEVQLARLYRDGARAVGAYQATAWFPAAAQGEATIAYGVTGFSKTLSGGLLCGLEALDIAMRAITLGHVRAAIVGVSEALRARMAVSGLIDIPASRFSEAAVFFALSDAALDEDRIGISARQEACVDTRWSLTSPAGLRVAENFDPFHLAAQPLLELASLRNSLVRGDSAGAELMSSDSGRKFVVSLERGS